MRSVTREEMQRLDQTAIENYSIPSLLLMENAGRAVSEVIRRAFPSVEVVIFSGKGNNGGDGLVVARHLANWGYKVRVILLENPLNLRPDPRTNHAIVQKMKIPLFVADERTPVEVFASYCQQVELIVDAIFGIGINSLITGRFSRAVHAINGSERPVVSIDIPSGLDANTGEVHGIAIKAVMTVALALTKKGFYTAQGPVHTGKIETVDIGIPHDLLALFQD